MSEVETMTLESMELDLPASTAKVMVVVDGGFGVETGPANFGPAAKARFAMADLTSSRIE